MRRVVSLTAICLSMLGFAAVESIGAVEDADRFIWLDNLDEARLIAKARQQPLLIVFRCEP